MKDNLKFEHWFEQKLKKRSKKKRITIIKPDMRKSTSQPHQSRPISRQSSSKMGKEKINNIEINQSNPSLSFLAPYRPRSVSVKPITPPSFIPKKDSKRFDIFGKNITPGHQPTKQVFYSSSSDEMMQSAESIKNKSMSEDDSFDSDKKIDDLDREIKKRQKSAKKARKLHPKLKRFISNYTKKSNEKSPNAISSPNPTISH